MKKYTIILSDEVAEFYSKIAQISKNDIEIKLGELYELKPTVENADNSKVNYTSLNEEFIYSILLLFFSSDCVLQLTFIILKLCDSYSSNIELCTCRELFVVR